jgi:hypothetical protein
MSVNKYRSHILVLPEDEATRQMANGFYQKIPDQRYTQILPVAGGCDHVVDCFKSNYMPSMNTYPYRYFVLVIDFDKRPSRLQHIKNQIDPSILARVFILGAFLEAEDLRRNVGENLETIGQLLAEDCQNQTMNIWRNELFEPLQDEIERAKKTLRPLIFI